MADLYTAVRLRTVRLKRLDALNLSWDPESPPERKLSFGVDSSADQQGENYIVCRVALTVRAQSPDLEKTYLEFIMEHELGYQCSIDGKYKRGQLDYFRQHTPIFNVWPYWRQLLHQVLGSMEIGLPLLPSFVPMFQPGEIEELQPDQPTRAIEDS